MQAKQAKTPAKTPHKTPAKRKPAPVKASATAAAEKPITAAAAHIAAGVNPDHVNADRKTRVGVGVTKYKATVATLKTRPVELFASLRATYGDKPFPARSLDNALLARLINAGLLGTAGGFEYAENGVAFLGDAPDSPLLLKINPDHAEFGKA